jgi:hypothetical protein
MKSVPRVVTRTSKKSRSTRLRNRICSALRASAEILGAVAALVALLQAFKLLS